MPRQAKRWIEIWAKLDEEETDAEQVLRSFSDGHSTSKLSIDILRSFA